METELSIVIMNFNIHLVINHQLYKLKGLCSDCFHSSCGKDIRLSENPVADPGRGGIPRFVLIARLSKVEILNGSEVNSRCCVWTQLLLYKVVINLMYLSVITFQVSRRERKESEIR